MATYNGERYLEQQLRSILTQLGDADEVVVSDDTSTDATLDIIRAQNDPRVTILANGRFKSPIYNMENALRHARGAFIFLSDQDDVWLDQKVSRMLEALKTCELAVCDCRVVDERLALLHPSFFDWIGARAGFFRTLWKTPYVGNCMAIRRSLLDEVLPFPSGLPMHDWWIALVAEIRKSVCLVREPLVLFRRHSATTSTSFGRSKRNLLRKLVDRVRLLFLVVHRVGLDRGDW